MPAEACAAVSLPGFALACATNSCRFFAWKSLRTARMSPVVMKRATGVKSFCGSNGSFRYRLGLAAKVVLFALTSVYPSGAARAASATPMLPFAPALFSITNGCPSVPCMCCVVTRITWSGADPAWNGTITRTGLFG
jgi:hypothetical protein